MDMSDAKEDSSALVVLNAGGETEDEASETKAKRIILDLNSAMRRIEADFVDQNGLVDYRGK